MNTKRIADELVDVTRRADDLLAQSRELLGELDDANRAARAALSRPYSIQAASANRKLSPIRVETANSGRARFVPTGPFCVSTYVSISGTCPRSCPFRDNGCFAQAGQSHLTMGRLDRAAARHQALDITRGEAAALEAMWKKGVPQDGARGGRDLRLHVGGDASCERGARALGDAVASLQSRGLGSAWTYTHRWRHIDRSAWGPISVLASCETPLDIRQAVERGYAPALTVAEFTSRRAFEVAPGIKGIPCPYEANGNGPTCVECRLCLDRDLLKMKRAIVFAAHGADAESAKSQLRRLRVV